MMKSCLLENPAETQLDVRCLPPVNRLEDDCFATVPMFAISQKPEAQKENEEELYTSFEEAISDRVARISRQLSGLPLAGSYTTIALAAAPASNHLRSRFPRWCEWRRTITLFCLALSLFMAGFDLLGLLIVNR